MVDYHGRFAWYELITTDMAAAKAFYAEVVGWGTQDASTPDLAYTLFTAGKDPGRRAHGLAGGSDDEWARRRDGWAMSASMTSDATADRFKRLGGAVYVPPTDSNIGRIAVVADPQTATLGVVKGLKPASSNLPSSAKPGMSAGMSCSPPTGEGVCFLSRAFRLAESGRRNRSDRYYQLFSVGGRTIGGMFTKRPREPVPFWLLLFQCRRYRRGRGAREERRRRGLRGAA